MPMQIKLGNFAKEWASTQHSLIHNELLAPIQCDPSCSTNICICDAAHTCIAGEVQLTKADPNRTRFTIGGNIIHYTGNCGTEAGSLETTAHQQYHLQIRCQTHDCGPLQLLPQLSTPSTRIHKNPTQCDSPGGHQ